MAFSYPIFSIVPCCPDLGEQLDNFRELVGFQPMFDELPGTFTYEGSNQTLNGIQFKTGYCYTVTQVGFGLLTGFGFDFSLFNQIPVGSCEPGECACLLLNGDAEYYGGPFTVNLIVAGVINGRNYYEGNDDLGYEYKIESDGLSWNLYINNVLAATQEDSPCPVQSWNIVKFLDSVSTENTNCSCEPCESPLPSCYKLTKCGESTPSIISNTPALFEFYENNKVVKLLGYEECYTIDAVEDCDCAVSVTVTQSYDDCEDCLPVVAYKFTNCDNPSLVQYSTNDYSAYVGKTVELECGGCWTVSEINIIPPSTQDPVIQYVFDNCAACKATYYELSDCLDPNGAKIYTATNLSSYLGKIIKIEGCNKCLSISVTREPINPTNVVVVNDYTDCPECLDTFPCNCTQVTNTTTETQTYCYLDCDFDEQTITLEPGETSDKICVINWITCKSSDCGCLEAFVLTDDFEFSFKFDKTDLTKNGKPVYTSLFLENNTSELSFNLSYEADNCWHWFTSEDSFISLPILKLCNNSNCPTGEWEQVTECTSFDAQITIDGFIRPLNNWFINSVDVNGYYTYVVTSDNEIIYSIKYNSSLNRWELFDENDVLLAYYNTESSCPVFDKPDVWTSVNPNISFVILETNPVEPAQLTIEECQTGCDCITYELTVPDGGNTTAYGVLQNTGTIINGKPVYASFAFGELPIEIYWDNISNCWVVSEIGDDDLQGTLCNSSSNTCPIGTWIMNDLGVSLTTEYCTTNSGGSIANGSYPTYIQNFGACINGVCPTIPLPKKFIKPGYSVPACDVEKYEKFACKSSEILYKQVLEKRYGITNCCPEGEYDQRWIIKKELADLQGLMDPNYNCTPVDSCCNKAPSCNCH